MTTAISTTIFLGAAATADLAATTAAGTLETGLVPPEAAALDSFAAGNAPQTLAKFALGNTFPLGPLAAARSISGSKQSPHSPDDLDEARFQREIAMAKDFHLFRYGRLADDHPAQRYLDQLASQIPLPEGFNPRFLLSPDWLDINAYSLPDGTIFISWKLFEEVKTKEALLGVMAHEVVHALREHVHKSRRVWKRKEESFASRVLRSIGQDRLHEYEADLRGTVEILEKMKVSPLPFKEWLEELHERGLEKGSGYDIVHGSALDRALNIATAIYLVDLRGVEGKNYQPIPDELLADPKLQGNAIHYSAIVHHPRFRGMRSAEEVKAMREERLRQIESLKSEELPHAIYTLWNQIVQNEGKEDEDPDDKAALQKALDRFACLTGIHDKEDLSISLWAFADIDPFSAEWLEPIAIQSYDDLERIRLDLEKALQNPSLPYALSIPDDLAAQACSMAIRKGLLEAEEGKLDLNRLQSFLKDWIKTLTELSQAATSPLDESGFKYWLAESLFKKYPNQKVKIIEAIYGKQKIVVAAEHSAAIQKLASSLTYLFLKPQEAPPAVRKAGPALLKIVGDAPLKQLGGTVQLLHTALTNIVNIPSLEDALDSSDDYSLVDVVDYITSSLFQYVLDHSQGLASLSSFEKDLIALSTALQFRLDQMDAEGEAEIVTSRSRELADPSPLYREKADADKVWSVYRWLTDIEFFRNETGLSIDTPRANRYETKNEETAVVYAAHFLAQKDLTEILPLLDAWKAKGADVEDLLASNSQALGELQIKLAEAVESGVLVELELSDLIRMSAWIANPTTRSLFQRYALQHFWPGMDFNEKLDVVFPLPGRKGISDGRTKNDFVEGEIQTQGQFRSTKDQLEKSVDTLLDEGSPKAGLAVLGDLNLEYRNTIPFFKALLATQTSDKELKVLVYDLLHIISSGLDKDESSYARKVVSLIHFAENIVRLLLTLDPLGKQLLLRKLLVGQGGVLTQAKTKEAFFLMLFKDWIRRDPAQADLLRVIESVLASLVIMEEWEPLYFALQSVLADQIAVPPSKRDAVSWHLLYPVQADLGKETARKLLRNVVWQEVPKDVSAKPWKYVAALARHADQRLYEALERKGIIALPAAKAMTPLRLVKETASRMGAMGVRFLQLLPLIVDLKPEYAAEFAEVYDRVKGQSKLAALALLEREWPELWGEIAQVGETVGGGSVVTVYEAINKKGEQEIIKVRNPNIGYHLGEVYRFASQVLDILIAHSEKGEIYRAARLLLDDIYAWVQADIDFKDFLEQDRQFKTWTEELNLASGGYHLYVPRSFGAPSPYYAREEFVEGINLTQWETLVKQGHDMKAVVALMVKFYLMQVAQGRVLSDIHPGNAAVTADQRVAIYDRNFYLNLTPAERKLVGLFLNPVGGAKELAEAFYEYLAVNGNGHREEIQSLVGEIVAALKSQDWVAAQKGLVRLKQLGIKMPLNFTLLLKNFQSLNQMARRAGFASLFEAAGYNSAESPSTP